MSVGYQVAAADGGIGCVNTHYIAAGISYINRCFPGYRFTNAVATGEESGLTCSGRNAALFYATIYNFLICHPITLPKCMLRLQTAGISCHK